ncbi:response regulator [Nakamurella silvestris]|nr:response regulator [Nakamurella silvestris]
MTVTVSERILIADDDPDIRELLSVAVSKAGHEVAYAAVDGSDALAAARRESIRMAILDVSMPNMTGLEVCAALRADPRTAGVTVVLVSAGVQDSAVQAGLDVGADRYLTKPFSPRALARVISELLDRPAENGNLS